MNKVDVMSTPYSLSGGEFKRPPGHITHAPYRREPYIRVSFPDGVRDGKALAWTPDMVLFHAEPEGEVTNAWVPASTVRRIPREESAWIDPYDLLR